MPQREHDPYATDPEFKQEWFGEPRSRRSMSEGRDRRIDYLFQGVILAGILGLVGIVWNLRDEVTKITTFVSTKTQQYDRDISRIDNTLARHDERITVIERTQGSIVRLPEPQAGK